MSDKINELIDKFKYIMKNKGVGVLEDDKINEMIDKIDNIEIYDYPVWPPKNPWLTATNMTTARRYLTSDEVDGKIYVIGGHNGSYLNKNECYDPTTNTWSTKANMTTSRIYVVSSVVGTKIYCIGGYYSDSIYLNTNECYVTTMDK